GTNFFGPNQDKDGLKISTNEATGEVTISVAAGTGAGTAEIPVTVRYTDGTSKKVSFKLTIEPAATTKPTDPTKPSEPSEPTPPTPEPTPPTSEPTPPTSPSERP
nr:Rib/alpha-like domain-containing protein [Escherichia coli]